MRNQEIVRAYSIQEVSKLLHIPTGTIRQWEKDLHDLVVIPRTKQGARYYTAYEIELLKTIQELRAQNVGKGMIRNLLKKHLESLEQNGEVSTEEALELTISSSPQSNSMVDINMLKALSLEMSQLQTTVVQEVRQEMAYQRTILLDEIKNQLEHTSLQTVSDLSKSIQRANDKRKADVLVLSEAIDTKVNSMKNALQLDNAELVQEVSQLLADAKNDMSSVAFSLHEDQQNVRNSVLELQEYSKAIQQKEEGFQELVLSFREAAAAKQAQKPWWKVW